MTERTVRQDRTEESGTPERCDGATMAGMMARAKTWLAAATLSLPLAACATLFDASGAPPALYDLTAPTGFTAAAHHPVQLLLPVPTASDALASNRVAVRGKDGSFAYYPSVSWTDQLPVLVQTALGRSFENSGRIRAVGKPGQGLAIDDQLIVDIRVFELDVANRPTAHVALGVKLLDDRNGRVIAGSLIETTREATSDRPADAVTALTAAADDAFRQVVDWATAKL